MLFPGGDYYIAMTSGGPFVSKTSGTKKWPAGRELIAPVRVTIKKTRGQLRYEMALPYSLPEVSVGSKAFSMDLDVHVFHADDASGGKHVILFHVAMDMESGGKV